MTVTIRKIAKSTSYTQMSAGNYRVPAVYGVFAGDTQLAWIENSNPNQRYRDGGYWMVVLYINEARNGKCVADARTLSEAKQKAIKFFSKEG